MKTKNIILSLLAVFFVAALTFIFWHVNSRDGLASVANASARVYVTKGIKVKGDKGYVQVTLEIDKKKGGVTTIGHKVNSTPKKVGLEE